MPLPANDARACTCQPKAKPEPKHDAVIVKHIIRCALCQNRQNAAKTGEHPKAQGIFAGIPKNRDALLCEEYYADEKFIRVLNPDVCPETKWVEGSNYVDINFKIDERTGRIVIMGALDNLVKGAAGQAVQNMNLLFGLEESEGLEMLPVFP